MILITQLSLAGSLLQRLESGAANFVTRPFEPEHLVDDSQATERDARLLSESWAPSRTSPTLAPKTGPMSTLIT